jgi:methylamine---glutamate N-methyltransferase subunit B
VNLLAPDRPAHVVDLATTTLRELNASLHAEARNPRIGKWRIVNPRGQHAIACGVDADIEVEIEGHVGYYCASMNKRATVTIYGNAGTGVAENIMSGRIFVEGDASQSAGATGRGGLLVVKGNASARCGISMKGIDIVVCKNVGHMSAFMAQSGNLVVLGNAGDALGDSIYEARLFIRGSVRGLGADCVEKKMEDEHLMLLSDVLDRAGISGISCREFRRYGSARKLYNFHVDNIGAY